MFTRADREVYRPAYLLVVVFDGPSEMGHRSVVGPGFRTGFERTRQHNGGLSSQRVLSPDPTGAGHDAGEHNA